VAVTIDDLAVFMNKKDGVFSEAEEAFATAQLATARALVNKALRGGIPPQSVTDTAVLQTASELMIRKDSPAGFRQLAEGNTGRVALDPMKSSYALIAPWQKLGPVF
jgi:hypothetical protein